MMSDPATNRAKAFDASFFVGRWLVAPRLDELTLAGRRVKLEPRTMRLLVVLAERSADLVTANELMERVWPDVVVTSSSLYQAVAELRDVLKADHNTALFIATVPRKGYRLVAPVTPVGAAGDLSARALAAATDAPTQLGPRSLAVLPFRDLGLAPKYGFLREALLGALIVELSRQPGMVVIARGTMLGYLGRADSPRQIAQALGVRYVVDGSISTTEQKLQITCELVEGAREVVAAAETMAVAVGEWPDIVREVVGRLARALRLEVTEAATHEALPAGDTILRAQELAMKAWVELYCRPQTHETNDRAWAFAREALLLDESRGEAWNALAYCEWRAAQYNWGEQTRSELLEATLQHAQRAIDLSPRNPDAYYSLALVNYLLGECVRAEATLRHCIELAPSYAPAHGLLGILRAMQGWPHQAFEHCGTAFAISPLEPLRAVWHWFEACASSMLGDEAAAHVHACRGIAANPDYQSNYIAAAVAAYRLGDRALSLKYVCVLRANASFTTTGDVGDSLPPYRIVPWGPRFVSDLRKAGMPTRGP